MQDKDTEELSSKEVEEDDDHGFYDDEKPRKPKGKRLKKFKCGADERSK